ncbi:hypothetical protein BDR22DRAFT_892479 [Usnea florida]
MGTTTSDGTNIASLVQQLQGIKASDIKDEESRKALFEAARNAAFTLESPGDSIQRITCITTAARLASDLRLFEILSKDEGSTFSTEQLAETTQANHVLLGRILRYLASVGMIDEVGEDQWAATNITKTLGVPRLKAGIYHNHDNILPCWQVLPEFLAETKYQNPSDGAHCPFQKGRNPSTMPTTANRSRYHVVI